MAPKAKHKVSALTKAVTTNRHKAAATAVATNTICMDSRTAAATVGFSIEEMDINKASKRAPTNNTGMKTVLAGESSINVERRIRAGAVPVGVFVQDEANVDEDLTVQGLVSSLNGLARRLMPRRPAWSFDLSSGRLHHREVQAFKQWLVDVRQLIADRGGYPPAFESNLQVWRQLWRVLERCDVAVVVVDARHPLLHLPPALLFHVCKTLTKPLVVVLNKLDAVDPASAVKWATHLRTTVPGISDVVGFSKEAINEVDFAPMAVGKSALIASCHKALGASGCCNSRREPSCQQMPVAMGMQHGASGDGVPAGVAVEESCEFEASQCWIGPRPGRAFKLGEKGLGYYLDRGQPKFRPQDRSCLKVGTSSQQEVNKSCAEEAQSLGTERKSVDDGRVMIGLVGHPNVGKSSLVNSIFGGKVVSVKATPGHTKTLQTLILDDRTCLCDSPGVVFPRLEVPRETQIVGMLIPLAQVREPFSAIRWVMEHQRTPIHELLNVKPISFKRVMELQEAGTDALRLDLVESAEDKDMPWSPMLLCAQYASQRGLLNNGAPDCHRAGLEILERVLDGRIAYEVRPPIDPVVLPKEDVGAFDDASDYCIGDSDYESEHEPEQAEDLFEHFGVEKKEPGSGSKASVKKQARRKKLAAIAGDSD